MNDKHVSISNVLAQSTTTGPYSTWTEDALVNEVMHRRLVHGVSIASFPDEAVRKSRLVEMLEGNDKLRSQLKTIAERYAK